MRFSKYLATTLCGVLSGFFIFAISPAKSENISKPPGVFIDTGVCPFECCTYRQWTVNRPTTIWDKPNGNQKISSLNPGDIVTGLTGEIISKPVPITATRDIPESPIKAGDTFYLLHYEELGSYKVWFDGKLTTVDEDDLKNLQPNDEWWVKIKDSKGNIGWALSNRNFDHQDACE